MQHNGGITPVASFKDLASASQQAFAQGGAPTHQSNPAGSPSQQVCLPRTMLCTRFRLRLCQLQWQPHMYNFTDPF